MWLNGFEWLFAEDFSGFHDFIGLNGVHQRVVLDFIRILGAFSCILISRLKVPFIHGSHILCLKDSIEFVWHQTWGFKQELVDTRQLIMTIKTKDARKEFKELHANAWWI